MYIRVNIYICVYIHIFRYIYIYLHTCMCIHIYTQMYIFIYLHVYIYIYICIHIWIYIYIYVYSLSNAALTFCFCFFWQVSAAPPSSSSSCMSRSPIRSSRPTAKSKYISHTLNVLVQGIRSAFKSWRSWPEFIKFPPQSNSFRAPLRARVGHRFLISAYCEKWESIKYMTCL